MKEYNRDTYNILPQIEQKSYLEQCFPIGIEVSWTGKEFIVQGYRPNIFGDYVLIVDRNFSSITDNALHPGNVKISQKEKRRKILSDILK